MPPIKLYNLTPSDLLIKTDGILISLASPSPAPILTKSSVQSAPLLLLNTITARAPAFCPFNTLSKNGHGSPEIAPLSIRTILSFISDEFDNVLHPSIGLALTILSWIPSAGIDGPKDAERNCISDWPSGFMILILFPSLTYDVGFSVSPPNVLYQVSPPSSDFQRPFPSASPAV